MKQAGRQAGMQRGPRPVLGADDVAPGALDHVGNAGSLHNVLELLVNILNTAHAAEHLAGLLEVAALNQGHWGVGEHDASKHDDQARGSCSTGSAVSGWQGVERFGAELRLHMK